MTRKPIDILASHIAKKFDDPRGIEARKYTKRFIYENVFATTPVEQAYECALVDATLERAARFQEGDDSDDGLSSHARL